MPDKDVPQKEPIKMPQPPKERPDSGYDLKRGDDTPNTTERRG